MRLEIKISYFSLIKFAAPTVAMFVLMNVYFIIDGIFVSRAVGTNALAAVNLVMPVLGITFALAAMLSTGGNAFVARQLGERNLLDARQNFSLIVASTFVGSTVLAILCMIFLRPLLSILGTDEQLFELCRVYSIPLLISVPFVMGGMVVDNFFVVEGRPELSLLSSTIGGVINLVLDYIFLFEMGMGIEGAAIATAIGYTLSAVVGLVYFGVRRRGTLYFVRPIMRPRVIFKAMSNGISELVTALSMSVVTIVLNNTMIMLAGGTGVAAMSIAMYVEELLLAIYLGYSEGIAPLTSFNQGEGNFDKLRRIYRCSLKIIAVAAVSTFVLSLIVADPLVRLFVDEYSPVHLIAVHGFKIFAASFLFAGVNVFASSMFTALNDGRTSAILSFCHTIVFLLGMLIILPRILGVDGVWLASPAAEFLSALMSFYVFRRMRRQYHYD